MTASAPQKARLIVKNRTPDKRDLLVWKFTRGNQVTGVQLGDPINGTTSYRLCLWDASAHPQPLFSADLAPGGTCGVRPCWKAVGSGAKFTDRSGLQHGTSNVLLKYGTTAKSKAQWKGKNVLLLPPTLPLAPSVTVQLENSEGTCWTTTFPTALANTNEQFKAKGD